MSVSFEYCSLKYLDWWLSTDERIYKDLRKANIETKRLAIVSAAKEYKVVRNLQIKYEKKAILNKKRLEPVLRIIEKPEYSKITKENVVDIIDAVNHELTTFYSMNLLSFTTKLLWFKNRNCVNIYDSMARKTLTDNELDPGKNDILTFMNSWQKLYRDKLSEITEVCKSLKNVRKYSENYYLVKEGHCSDNDFKNMVESLGKKTWFKKRVFDFYLVYSAD